MLTVGHNAVVHGAMVGDGTLIGMGAVILDGAKIGRGVHHRRGDAHPGRQGDPRRQRRVRQPVRIVRQATEAERQGNLQNAAAYLRLAEAFAAAGEGAEAGFPPILRAAGAGCGPRLRAKR